MNAVVVERRPRQGQYSAFGTRVVNVPARGTAKIAFSSIALEPGSVVPLQLEELSEHWNFLSSEAPLDVATVTAIAESTGILHTLQVYTGAALLGSVICGLAFGWSEHTEAIQWAGAIIAIVACGFVRHRRR